MVKMRRESLTLPKSYWILVYGLSSQQKGQLSLVNWGEKPVVLGDIKRRDWVRPLPQVWGFFLPNPVFFCHGP